MFSDIAPGSPTFETIGKKAQSLVMMRSWGIPVPEGACLSQDVLDRVLREAGLQDARSELAVLIARQDPAIERVAAHVANGLLAATMPLDVRHEIECFLARHPEARFAVRSSGNKEDLQDASFAGLYTSVLNVKSLDDILAAIHECWASLFGRRVIGYCANKGIDFATMGLGVIIQTMVPAEKSGVLFTVNPLKGFDREIIVEACFGLGEALVGGKVTPDRYHYNWYQEKITETAIGDKQVAIFPIDEPPFLREDPVPEAKSRAPVLSPCELAELCSIATRVQAHYGFPVDIEWTWSEGSFSIVQSRPITSVKFSGIEGEWTTADFKDGGVSSTVCSPFMWSLYDLVWERELPAYLEKVKLLEADHGVSVWGDMFFGRPYWYLTPVKRGLERLPGFVERRFDEDLGVQVTYEGSGARSKTTPTTIIRALRVLSALKKSFNEQVEYCPTFIKKQKQALARLDKTDPLTMGREELFRFYEDLLLNDFYRSESSYFRLIFDNSNASSLFTDSLRAASANVNFARLLGGLTDLSHLRTNIELWDVSRIIRNSATASAIWRATPVAKLVTQWRSGSRDNHLGLVADLIERHKYHSTRELDITVPRYGEDPSFIMESIKAFLDLDDAQNPRTISKQQLRTYLDERERLLRSVRWHRRRSIGRKLDQWRWFLWWREELRDYSTRYYYQVRRFTLAVATHFKNLGILESQDDIFFLPLTSIIGFMNGHVTPEKIKREIRQNTLYYRSFSNYAPPNEIGRRFGENSATNEQATNEANANGNGITGIACSPGVFTGRARVIRNIHEAHRLERGDILITKFTDPGWTPKFNVIAAVATETGGMLSHAAVLSREYGIPAVLACKNITSLIPDGAVITIDGDKGWVRLATQGENN